MSEGKIIQPNTQNPEEPASMSKEELFKQEPDNFFHLSEMLMAVKTDEKKQHSVFIGNANPIQLGGALFLLLRHCLKTLDMIDFQRVQEKNQSAKIAAEIGKKGFRDFIRRK